MMLAGIPVATPAVHWIALTLRESGAHAFADRLDRTVSDDIKLVALTIDERALILNTLDDPPEELGELRAVLMNEQQWRGREGLG